jgi:hypothetical protein
MRAFAAVSVLAFSLSASLALAQSSDGGVASPAVPPAIAVPPAPPMVAAPPSVQPIPAPALPPPPGLVPATPPADIDTGDNGATPAPGDGSAATGQAATAPTQAAPAPAAPTPAAPVQDIAPIPPNTWLPQKTAEIGVLDKVDGSVSTLSIPVGGQSVVGDLQVNVQACMTRPPDQVPDAAVFLALQSTQNPAAPPDYRGWLVKSAPGAAVAGDASETFRIIDCS